MDNTDMLAAHLELHVSEMSDESCWVCGATGAIAIRDQ